MNFLDFKCNLIQMENRIKDEEIDPKKVQILHTKSTGENIIAAIYGENIIDYFKW